MTGFGPLYESNTSGTQLGAEALALKTKLATQGARGIMFGQEQAVFFGCANAAGNHWTYADWRNATAASSGRLPSDLRYASESVSEDVPLEPVVYGFEMAFITDLDFIAAKLGSYAALRSQSFWPFGELFGTDEGLLQPSADTAAPSGGPTVHSPVPSQLQILVRDEHVNILKRIHESGGVATFVWHLQNLRTEGSLSYALHDERTADIHAALNLNRLTDPSPTVVLTRELRLKLDRVADFANACVTNTGEKIPFIFRPWHEMNLNFFWWGNPATTAQYRRLFDCTVKYLTDNKAIDNILYAYSPNMVEQAATQLSGSWNNSRQQSHMVSVFSAWKPTNYDIAGLDAYPARFSNEYVDYRRGRFAFIDSVRALREFAASESTNRPIAAITEVGVLNLRGFRDPLPDVPAARPVYSQIDRYWREHLLSDLSTALLPFTGGTVGSNVCFFMLWKNRDATDHVSNTTAINQDIHLSNSSGSTTTLSSASTRKEIFKSDGELDEFYGPFLGHPETPGFVAIARSGSLTSAGPTLRMLFLHDMP